MKKIVFLINTLGVGGAERALVELSNILYQNDFDITIKTMYDGNSYIKELNPNIKVKSLLKPSKSKLINKIGNHIALRLSAKTLYKLIIKEKYDIEVAFLEGWPTKIMAASTNKKSKKIAWIHCDIESNHDSLCFYKSLEEEKEAYLKYDQIHCVSNHSKESFKRVFGISDNVFVANNIINKENILLKSKESIIDNFFDKNNFNILTIGRLVKHKNYLGLLEIFKKAVSKSSKKLILYIIGDGEEKELIINKINELNLNDNVILLGKKSNPYNYLNECDLFVSSSKSEGSSIVFYEALALNKPIVTTNSADQEDTLLDVQFGIVTKDLNDTFVDGILKLANDQDFYNKCVSNIKKYNEKDNGYQELIDLIIK